VCVFVRVFVSDGYANAQINTPGWEGSKMYLRSERWPQ